MAAPVVQDLGQILAELEPAFAASRGLYNQQIQALPGQEQAATQQLEYAKTNSFRDIARGANSRGVDFWGIPIEEQGRYLGEHFLPGMAKVKAGTQQAQTQLQLALAELEKDKYTRGIERRTGQEQARQSWESEQQRLALEREKMAQADRQHQASLRAQAASRPKESSNVELFAKGLAAGAGRDGKVDPQTYNSLKQQWVASGYGDYKSFHDKFWRFANDKHWWDYR